MGPIMKKKNNNTVYNPTLLENWTIARLKAELEKNNIAFPINAKRLTLVRILKRYENSDSEGITSNTTNARGDQHTMENTRTAPNAAAESEEQLLNIVNSGNMGEQRTLFCRNSTVCGNNFTPVTKEYYISLYEFKKRGTRIPQNRVQYAEKNVNDQVSPSLGITTPIVISNLVHELENHPNKEFKNYLVSGLSQGFSTGIRTLPSNSIECKNLRSALPLSQPAHVLKLIESEVEKGYLEGPFDFIPFKHYRINPIGVAEGKYNKKKR
ncbi:unnamed protein product [Mytilus coruscus]|uniref:SAP domain-containing protein n=1 Tax=Mytilus coruscus TaxID=42192 RepID=A0A6J8CP12_MYTCO|nr:unnamed protein product [Mytilus coruscus]